jgi:hypothetical protein
MKIYKVNLPMLLTLLSIETNDWQQCRKVNESAYFIIKKATSYWKSRSVNCMKIVILPDISFNVSIIID